MAGSVLVTDGDERSSLAVVRSLGRADYRVGVTSAGRRSLAGSSRHAIWSCLVPDPVKSPEDYAARLRDIVVARSIDVVLPMTEASLLSILPRREMFSEAVIPFPSFQKFRAITDKARVVEEARNAGVKAPEQVILSGPDASSREIVQSLRFPVVLKPTRSVGEAGSKRQEVGVVHVEVPEELDDSVAGLPPQAFPLLVQEKIKGTGAGIFLLTWRGRLIAHFAHRRIREKPPSGGVSVFRESLPANAALVKRSVALLERFGWEGIAMVEYKIEDESGNPYIMEINPRFWGSLQLAIDSGVDFPRLLVDLSLGNKVEPVTSYQVGVRTRWLWGEVDHLISRVSSACNREGVAGGVRELVLCGRALVFDHDPKNRWEVWNTKDPRPFLRETLRWFRNLWS